MGNRRFCYFDSKVTCRFPIACPRDSYCVRATRSIPIPNTPAQDQYHGILNTPVLGQFDIGDTMPGKGSAMSDQVVISITVNAQRVVYRIVPGEKVGDVLIRLVAVLNEGPK